MVLEKKELEDKAENDKITAICSKHEVDAGIVVGGCGYEEVISVMLRKYYIVELYC